MIAKHMRPALPLAIIRPLRLLAAATLICSHAQAQTNSCPWINQATAAALLAGAPTIGYTDASAGAPATCTLRSTAPGGTRTLLITVETASSPQSRFSALVASCASVARITGLGTEAVSCPDRRDASAGEKVVGRVRDQVFTILLTTTFNPDPVLTPTKIKARALAAAEQVSGNLF